MRHGRQRKALFIADWLDAAFVHFRVDPRRLQPLVPLQLDLFNGHAHVSLVAFTQRNLRPTIGGALAAWLATPLGTHDFLNVRTYVRHGSRVGRGAETRGIYFLAEWIPNRLACLIGPRTYGLPYRFGRLNYQPNRRCVTDGLYNLRFEISNSPMQSPPTHCTPGSLDHFLLERYTAFTQCRGVIRRFDVDHDPWPMQRARAELIDLSLLNRVGECLGKARYVLAHTSTGVRDVSISAPKRIQIEPRRHGDTEAQSQFGRASVSPCLRGKS